MVDADRLYLRSAARVAHAAMQYRGTPELAHWLRAQIEASIRELAAEDRIADRSGEPVDPSQDGRLVHLSDALGIDLKQARRACIAFNLLDRKHRAALWSVLVEGRSMLDHAREARVDVAQVRLLVQAGFEALNRAAGQEGGLSEHE